MFLLFLQTAEQASLSTTLMTCSERLPASMVFTTATSPTSTLTRLLLGTTLVRASPGVTEAGGCLSVRSCSARPRHIAVSRSLVWRLIPYRAIHLTWRLDLPTPRGHFRCWLAVDWM